MNREKQLSPGLSWTAADRWFVADHGRGFPGRRAAAEFAATGAFTGGRRLIAVSSGDIE
ncbi:hypothetical protein ACN9MG_14980 [Burkholderia ambifaria]|jgi:hypothetical protein|uniref:hypothetical protein n=1 Tax=Burkholderia TaxID=32008 RepID=UPI00158E4C13|nr:hypothetical protein [Burkholderia ambifaria]